MTDLDRTRPVPAPSWQPTRHWEDSSAYRAPAASEAAAPAPAERRQGRSMYREEALRERAERRAGGQVPVTISGPSFLLLWTAAAVVLAAGVAVVVLVVVR
ncbi:hypothetical protein ACIBQ1_42580 [Nonomuraea sp. NPDC050153]|uniref:hypothetical protein n=1 Tax=Nonomuraea sp. NPDC050153 TaxID=3364359 RepID=UPI00378CEE36